MAVLDASAAISLARGAAGADAGSALSCLLAEEEFSAPRLLCVEAAQAAWKYRHAGLLDDAASQELMQIAIGYVDEFVDDASLLAEAFREAARLDHSVYDMLYFVLARRKATALITCDMQLARLCDEHQVEYATLVDLR